MTHQLRLLEIKTNDPKQPPCPSDENDVKRKEIGILSKVFT